MKDLEANKHVEKKGREGWSTCLSWWGSSLQTAACSSHRCSSMAPNTEQNLSRPRTSSSRRLKESCEEAQVEVHGYIGSHHHLRLEPLQVGPDPRLACTPLLGRAASPLAPAGGSKRWTGPPAGGVQKHLHLQQGDPVRRQKPLPKEQPEVS